MVEVDLSVIESSPTWNGIHVMWRFSVLNLIVKPLAAMVARAAYSSVAVTVVAVCGCSLSSTDH